MTALENEQTFNYERLSARISQLGARASALTELATTAAATANDLKKYSIQFQRDIEDLYLSMDDIENPALEEIKELPDNLLILSQAEGEKIKE